MTPAQYTAERHPDAAFGQPCHVITTLGPKGLNDTWTHTLNQGVRHPSTERG